jgi:lysozyme family protein
MPSHAAVQFVLNEEGPSSNLPGDPGGLTRWGISSRLYPQVLDPRFSRGDAIAIYWKDYWVRCKCDQMPPAVGLLVLNCAVNQGQETAIKILQRALSVKEDGILGSATFAALHTAATAVLSDEFAAHQLLYYSRDRQFAEFGLGWMRRTIRAHVASLSG